MENIYGRFFKLECPAGIQSTVINFSNVLLQSSVNSFGSIAMAGYTAANNLLGFLYTSINSVTQACMSFTSQNYGVKKTKRMDRVLIDCIILSILIATVMGGAFYVFGPQILSVYNKEPDVIKSGMEILSFYNADIFFVWNNGSFSRRNAWNGALRRANDSINHRNSRHQNLLDLCCISKKPRT